MRRSALLAFVLVSGCVSAPPKPVTRAVTAPPVPVTVKVPAVDWRDWPRTPGDWRYAATPTGSGASYGAAGQRSAAFTCDRAARQVTISFHGAATPVTIRTTSISRVLPVTVSPDPLVGTTLSLTATDPLLDAIAFSRGRFTIEQAGAAPLVLPAWAEVGRVIEDCRG